MLKTALLSVQNQDFTEIEIIIIDDYSEDGSVKLIKELMSEDPRIVFLQNDKNRGALYTKLKGILNAKGKYAMLLDVDDLYAVEFAFSFLYEEIESKDLDILGFSSIEGGLNNNNEFHKHSLHNYFETPIIIQPELSKRSYIKDKNGVAVVGLRDVIWCYIYKTKFFQNVIKEIDDKYLNRIINNMDDIFVYFILVKKAKKLKHIKKIFYITIQENNNNQLMSSFKKKKFNFSNIYGCWDCIFINKIRQ